MEHGAFNPPFGEDVLAELGRATYQWGVADMLAENLLRLLAKTDMHKELIQPLMIDKKAQIIIAAAKRFPEGECRDAAQRFAKAIKKLGQGRNHAIHGFWGWHWAADGNHFPAAHSHKTDQPLKAAEISELADKIAIATRDGRIAMMLLLGRPKPSDEPANMWMSKGPPPLELSKQLQSLKKEGLDRLHLHE